MGENRITKPSGRRDPVKKIPPKLEKKSAGPEPEVIRAEPPPATCPLTDALTAAQVEAKKEEFVKRVRSTYTIGRVLRLMNLSRREFNRWCEGDEGFAEDVQIAQLDFVDEMEARLIKMAKGGKGQKKGDYMALVTFLNAAHLSYGRIRAEMLERALMSFIDLVVPIVSSHVDKATADAIRAELQSAAILTCHAAGGKRSQRAPASN